MDKDRIVTELVELYDTLSQSDVSTPTQDRAILAAIEFLRGRRK